MWLFAYGSIIFRPGFAFIERRRAFVSGYARRFWQGSPDHRGTPDAPGRVVTLVPAPGEHCGGVAYKLALPGTDTLAALDAREQAGFERVTLPLTPSPHAPPFAEGFVYRANPGNPHFLGPAPEPDIAAWIRDRRGPSGPNAEYVTQLAAALRELDIFDPHVEAVAEGLEGERGLAERADAAARPRERDR